MEFVTECLQCSETREGYPRRGVEIDGCGDLRQKLFGDDSIFGEPAHGPSGHAGKDPISCSE